jgi:hypothetical protein
MWTVASCHQQESVRQGWGRSRVIFFACGVERLQRRCWQPELPVPIELNELLHELPQVQ